MGKLAEFVIAGLKGYQFWGDFMCESFEILMC